MGNFFGSQLLMLKRIAQVQGDNVFNKDTVPNRQVENKSRKKDDGLH